MAVLAIRRRQLRHPVALAATLAHELAHARLLGERRIDPGRSDGEQLTDLATIFFGTGIFTANAAFDFSQTQSGSGHEPASLHAPGAPLPAAGTTIELSPRARGCVRPSC